MKKQIPNIITKENYDQVLYQIDVLMNKDEKSLSKEEIAWLSKTAELVEEYEDNHGMAPVPRSKELAQENDRAKIAANFWY